jgi:chemotaxis family two-component system response regulator Rcp1
MVACEVAFESDCASVPASVSACSEKQIFDCHVATRLRKMERPGPAGEQFSYRGISIKISAVQHASGKWLGDFEIESIIPTEWPTKSKPLIVLQKTEAEALELARQVSRQFVDAFLAGKQGETPKSQHLPPRQRVNRSAARECVVVHVEDDDKTAYLFQMKLREANLDPRVFRLTDGEEALAFLYRRGVYCEAARPDLVLLDLNLPRKSGFEVLAEIRRDPDLSDIIVVVFSTSTSPYDRDVAFELGADDYIPKGSDLSSFAEAVKTVSTLMQGEQSPRHFA